MQFLECRGLVRVIARPAPSFRPLAWLGLACWLACLSLQTALLASNGISLTTDILFSRLPDTSPKCECLMIYFCNRALWNPLTESAFASNWVGSRALPGRLSHLCTLASSMQLLAMCGRPPGGGPGGRWGGGWGGGHARSALAVIGSLERARLDTPAGPLSHQANTSRNLSKRHWLDLCEGWQCAQLKPADLYVNYHLKQQETITTRQYTELPDDSFCCKDVLDIKSTPHPLVRLRNIVTNK